MRSPKGTLAAELSIGDIILEDGVCYMVRAVEGNHISDLQAGFTEVSIYATEVSNNANGGSSQFERSELFRYSARTRVMRN
jgi:riboflavin synthase alpha subunit